VVEARDGTLSSFEPPTVPVGGGERRGVVKRTGRLWGRILRVPPLSPNCGAQSSMGPEPVLGNGDSVPDALQVQEQGMNILCSVSLPPVSHMVHV